MKKSILVYFKVIALIASVMMVESSFASEKKNAAESVSTETGMGTAMPIDSVIVTEQNNKIANLLFTSESLGGMDIITYLKKNLRYPYKALENGTEGNITVLCIVEKSGVISKVEAMEGSNEDLSNAVIKTLQGVKFQPILQNGHAIRYALAFPVNFKII
jgi:TonB family protein